MGDPKQLVGVSLLVSGGTLSLAELQKNGSLPGVDQWLGLMLAYTVIGIGADLGFPLAGGFAMLTMVAIVLSRGDEALGFAGIRLRGEQQKRKAALKSQRGGRPTPTTRTSSSDSALARDRATLNTDDSISHA